MLTACTFHHTNKYPAFALEPVHCTETTLRPPPPPPQSSSQKYHYLRCHNHLELTELLTPFWRSPFFFIGLHFTSWIINPKVSLGQNLLLRFIMFPTSFGWSQIWNLTYVTFSFPLRLLKQPTKLVVLNWMFTKFLRSGCRGAIFEQRHQKLVSGARRKL